MASVLALIVMGEILDEGTNKNVRNTEEGWDGAWRCVISWSRTCRMVQLESSPAATKLLILFLKLANFHALVSPPIPGDVSPPDHHLAPSKTEDEIWGVSDVLLPFCAHTWLLYSWQGFHSPSILFGPSSIFRYSLLSLHCSAR